MKPSGVAAYLALFLVLVFNILIPAVQPAKAADGDVQAYTDQWGKEVFRIISVSPGVAAVVPGPSPNALSMGTTTAPLAAVRAGATYTKMALGATLSTANLTLTVANVGLIRGTGMGGNRTVQLDSAANVGIGGWYEYRDFAGNVSVNGNITFSVGGGGSELNGSTTYSLSNTTRVGARFVSDGSVYNVEFLKAAAY